MEAYFQYQRVRRAVHQQLAELKEDCSCRSYIVGSPHDINCKVSNRRGTPNECLAEKSIVTDDLILVGWDGQHDPLNPANQSVGRKLFMTVLVSLIALSVTAASAIDACGVREYSEHFQVSEVVGSLATGLFLIGFAFGSLLSGPFSETFGRNAVYLTTMILYLLFIMASGLAPNLGSHLTFRFIAGFFASTPLSCAGGTVADLWNPLEKTYAFPVYAIPAFAGPMIGQMIGSYIPVTLGWRWLEWIMLIMGGAVLVLILLFQPETYGNLILSWKASILRKETGDGRYRSPMEMNRETLGHRLKLSVYRPFAMFYSELIIILVSLYLTIIYIVLFTFLEGYAYVFGQTYGISESLTSLCWAGMLFGILLVGFIVPVVYSLTAKAQFREKACGFAPEMRLWYTMLGGAPAVPISLFWMGWTSNPLISIWSPLIASVLFGFGITTIFIVSYMYLIDSYDTYSASALGFLVFTRYVVAGGVTVAGGPIYRALGVQHTLTVLGSVSGLMTPVPYLLYIYGSKIRKNSRYAVYSNTNDVFP
ncbi:major facilitator superfamily domain-containing protein [Fusarium redolens]|uniref:Major facilitator superfamily domain-containing protein n=2 Tax=Fusarium TaxID=5506 RepID=A0A9P9FX04_FUSRE|nr:major facilitator superfamily domain-containing protein [Fusarium redolens]KAH7205448.1 major facilitator superfamily domain-containing protein [Fusarium redolens]RKK91842.1 putative efflux pump kojT [Fusarium oxysporum]